MSANLPDLPSGIYRHWKGHFYFVFGYGHDANSDSLFEQVGAYDFHRIDTTEDGEDTVRAVVVYIGLELTGVNRGPRLAVRTAEDFFKTVCSGCGADWPCNLNHQDEGGDPVPRFTYIVPAWLGGERSEHR